MNKWMNEKMMNEWMNEWMNFIELNKENGPKDEWKNSKRWMTEEMDEIKYELFDPISTTNNFHKKSVLFYPKWLHKIWR